MSNYNLLIKKIKKQFLSISDYIEGYFNKIKYFKSNYKKILFKRDNGLILGIGILVILTLSYFLIPTFYNKEIIQLQIKNQIFKNYNIEIKFNEKINYGLLPKPHFSAKNLSIYRGEKEVGVAKNLRINVGLSKFFSINKIDMEDLIFNKTDFNISVKDVVFFRDLLKTEPNDNKIIFKKSNIFFKNKDDEVLFINKINNSEFFYDSNKLQNILISKSEVFKIPYKLTVKNDKFNKTIITELNSKKIRLKLDNEIFYDKEIKKGLLDILFVNKNTSLKYKITKNSFNFSSDQNKNSYKGMIDFKPFYLTADFNYEGLSSKNLFNENSILIDLINSEMLNNKNLSAKLNLNVKDITNINELKDLKLKILIEEGNIGFSESTIMWKKDLKIILDESFLTLDDGINLIGTIFLDFKNINNFYSSFQIQKEDRKDIKEISIDYVYNFNDKNFSFNNPRINNKQNIELEEFLNIFNSKRDRKFNKITFKNFVNNFFRVYAG
jgi:hypothetical protein